jgi:acetoin utilization protein AcuB
MMTVGDYTSSPLVSIDCRQSLAEAIELMRALRVRHLGVVDRGRPVGVLSERDVYRLEALKAVDPEVLPVGEAMTPEARVVAAEAPLGDVAREMSEAGESSVLVADGGHVVGIFTSSDALRALGSLAAAAATPASAPGPGRGDARAIDDRSRA